MNKKVKSVSVPDLVEALKNRPKPYLAKSGYVRGDYDGKETTEYFNNLEGLVLAFQKQLREIPCIKGITVDYDCTNCPFFPKTKTEDPCEKVISFLLEG